MMKFDCPHCGQQLVHSETVAGREGWCRFCKCILVMPQPGQPAIRQTLTLQQQFAQLERMFRFAAGIVDEHRQLQASLTNGKQGLAQAIESRSEAERSAEALRKELNRNLVSKTQLEIECKRLAEQLDRSMSEHTAYQTESEKRLEQVKLELKAHESRDGQLLDRVLAIEEDINRAERIAREGFDEIEQERDQLAKLLETMREDLAAARDAESALKAHIEEANERERALQTESLESKAAWEEKRLELEQECKRLTTLYTGEVRRRNEAEEALTSAKHAGDSVSDLEFELARTRKALTAAEEDAAQAKLAAENVPGLERELEEARTALTTAEKAANEAKLAQDDTAKLLIELEEARAALTTAEKAADEAKLAQDDTAKLQTELEEARTALTIAEKAAAKAKVAQDDSAKLHAELEEARTALTIAEKAAAETKTAQENSARLERELEEARASLTSAEEATAEAKKAADNVPNLERELEEMRASLTAAEEGRDALAEECSALKEAIEKAEAAEPDPNQNWEMERQELLDQVEHYRTVLQKVEDDLSAIDAKRQEDEAALRAQLDEKAIELLRETTQRVKAERLHDKTVKELEASKAALASAEENLKLLRESTASLKAEIDTALHAKAV